MYTADSGILPKKKTTYPSFSYPGYSPSTQYKSNITGTIPKVTTPKATAPKATATKATIPKASTATTKITEPVQYTTRATTPTPTNNLDAIKDAVSIAAGATSLIPGGDAIASGINSAYNLTQQNAGSGQGIRYETAPQVPENYFDPNFYMNFVMQQFGAQKAADLASLRQAYDQARAGYENQRPTIEQNARTALDQNDIGYYTQALPQLRAAMEAAGNYGGGEMLGQNVNLIAMKGQNANDINLAKSNQLREIANAINQLNAEQPLKEAELQASLDAEQSAAALQAMQQGLTAQNQAFNQNLATNQFSADQSYRAWQQQFQTDQAAWERSADNPTVKAQILANEIAAINMQYLPEQLRLEIQRIRQDMDNGRLTTAAQLDETRARIKQIADNSAQGWAQINWDRDPNNPSNQTKVAEPTQTETSNYVAASAMKELDKLPDIVSRRTWLEQHKAEIVQVAGLGTYNELKAQYGIY